MPIDNLSNRVKIPRLGKIHLGVKTTTNKQGGAKDYPKAVDYFVCPDEVKAIYGEKPRELDIMLPVEDLNQFAPQFLRSYTQSQGLVCIGDGVNAHRKVDTDTGAMASSKTLNWTWRDMPCNPQECPEYSTKKCRRVLNFLFLLPRVPGLGAWQIDTSSYNSIININSAARMIKAILGRCSMIPLTLVLRPQEVSPSGMKKMTVYVLDIKQDIKLADLVQKANLPLSEILLPEVTNEVPEDLYTTKELGEIPPPTEKAPTAVDTETTQPSKKEPAKVATKPKVETPPPTENAPAEETIKPDDENNLPGPEAKTSPEPETVKDDAIEKLIKRIHIEAGKISKDYYDNVIRPRIQTVFSVKSSKELNKTQLNTVLDWMLKFATSKDKQIFVMKMHELGYDGREAILEEVKNILGKEHDLTRGNLDKVTLTIMESRKEKKPKENPKDEDESKEVEDFLNMETQKLL